MNKTLVIARRELLEKRFVFVAAIAFAVLALIVPFMPGVHAGERQGALVVASGLLSIGFTVGLAAILGATIINTELSQGRLSFYFSKPLPAPSVWFGKLIAALLLIVLCFAIIAAPAFFAGPQKTILTWTNPPRDALTVIGVVLGFSVGLFLIAHVIGTFVRSRSAWLVFDFIALAVCATATWFLVRPLLLGLAHDLLRTLAKIVAVYAALGIVAAGTWQVAKGRADRKRSHVELSRFMWIAFGCGLLVMSGFVAWVVSATPADLIVEFSEQADNGSWTLMGGKTKHRGDYRAAFAYDTADGRWVRVSGLQPWWGNVFSEDGKTISWLMPEGDFAELYLARLDSAKARATPTGILFRPQSYTLSNDGSGLAMIDRTGILTVYDIASRDARGSARVPEGRYWQVQFVSPDVIRVYAFQEKQGPVGIFEYRVSQRRLERTGEFPHRVHALSRDFTRARVYVRGTLEIRDAKSGVLIATVAPAEKRRIASARDLRDGRIAALEIGDRAVLRVLTRDGTPMRDIELPAIVRGTIAAEGNPGQVVIATVNQRRDQWSTIVVDLDRGAVVRTEPGLQPLYHSSGPRLLCRTAAKDVVVWDLVTGEKRVVATHS